MVTVIITVLIISVLVVVRKGQRDPWKVGTDSSDLPAYDLSLIHI